MTEDNKNARAKIEDKIKRERQKEGEQKLEKIIRELNDANLVVQSKEQQAEDIINEYGL